MATMTHEQMATRVAARFKMAQEGQQAQQDGQQQGQQAQQDGQQDQQAMPKSGPGKMMVKGILDKVVGAFEAGEEEEFHKQIDALLKAAKHGM